MHGLATLCGLLLAANASLACTCWQLPFTFIGFGTFGTSPSEINAMGQARAYLNGSTVISLTVVTTGWGRCCAPVAFSISGTLNNGLAISGTATIDTTTSPWNSSFIVEVTSISVSNPATSQLLATDNGGFKLYFARIPGLQMQRDTNTITLSWNVSATNFVLEQASSPASPANSWTPVSVPVQTNGATISVSLATTNASGFFRLRKS